MMHFCHILANSADPDEMLLNAAYHLGLCCLPKYLFTGIQNEKFNVHAQFPNTRPVSAVGYWSDCRSRGCEFDPGPVPYFHGD